MGLFFSCIAFLATHFLMSHPAPRLARSAMGERPFRGVYSLIALVTFGSMIYFYHRIGREPSGCGMPATPAGSPEPSDVARGDPARRFLHRNPRCRERRAQRRAGRRSRHPMMWSFAFWAGVH
jgi:uncharacterized membrane protein